MVTRVPKQNLMNLVESIANDYYGGHFTIFAFTTEVKFSFGTINSREDIEDLTAYYDINDAILNGIQEHFNKIED